VLIVLVGTAEMGMAKLGTANLKMVKKESKH